VRSAGSSNSTGDGAKEMSDLAAESVGRRKTRFGLADKRMMDGTGCFFRKELDLDFL
jgi:hypothetical protein